MNIYLCGFMGSGKSTLLEKLQKETGKQGFDFDHEIAKRAGVLPEELGNHIEKIGWDAFRSLELELFKETLKTYDDGLFAFGGGTLTIPSVIDAIKSSDAKIYWLNTPIETCWERAKNEGHRPLVKAGKEAFFKLYEERLEIYQQFQEFSEGLQL